MAVAPGLSHWIPLPYGPFREFLRDPLRFQLEAQNRYGDAFRFRIGPLLIHWLYHPDHVRHVLHENQKNYLRGWQYRLVRRLFGNGLVVSEGETWRRQRRLAQPAFHRQRLSGYAEVMVDATSQLIVQWRKAPEGTPIDIVPELSRLTLAIASRTLFDRDVSHDADAVGTAFSVVAQYFEHRFNHPFSSLPIWLPTSDHRHFKRAARTLNEIVSALVCLRRDEGRDHGDLLSMLMIARDEETGESMTNDQVRSEVLTFLMAGHETTAIALTWACYLLCSHQQIQQRVRDEVTAVIGDRAPTVADVPHLTTTRMVIEESMRLFPPIWAVARQAVRDDEVGGFQIPARSTVVLSQYITHRHPGIWEEPDSFVPERFSADRAIRIPKGAYFPFLGGPHQCIGGEFAMLEMQLVLAILIQKFELQLAEGQTIQPKASITLRPSGPVRVVFKAVDRSVSKGLRT